MIGAWDYPFADNAVHPGSPLTRDGRLLLTGWALGWDGPTTVRVFVDGKLHEEVAPDFRREDIDIIFHTQKEATAPSGWISIVDTHAFKPGVHKIEAMVRSKGKSQPLGVRHIEFRPTEALKDASDRFLEDVLEGSSDQLQDRHQHYFGVTPGAWRKSPSSAMGFSGQARDLFRTCSHVLVVGAGVNNTVENVWQLDIFDYPNVDVITSGNRFPFRDGSFDGVICENVIEHVRDPRLLVREIERVLKPDGRVGINGTNLHFTHGFPYHFFNPTEWGMRLLLEEEGRFAGEYYNPDIAASLRTVLTYFENALTPAAREALGKYRFSEVLSAVRGQGPEGALAAIRSIAPEAEKSLSTNVYFLGRKLS